MRNAAGSKTPLEHLYDQILYPLVQVITVIQRLITAQVLDGKGAKYVGRRCGC